MENNILLKADSYKISHYKQYPKHTKTIYAYMESRGGAYPEQVFFGLQYILKKHLVGPVVTKEYVEEATRFWEEHFGVSMIDKEMWEHIIEKHGGHLPVRIKAVKEGTIVPTKNVLITIENTDPRCAPLTTFLETILLQVWYPITIATNSREIKKILLKGLRDTGEVSNVKTQLHDFGFRGSTSYESAAIGGCAHLTSFYGTDTIAGCVLARNYYSADKIAGYSIPATEHSTIVSWTKAGEEEAYANVLDSYPTGLVACVSDSYDIFNACENIWGGALRDKILSRDGTLVVRPDSGDPTIVLVKLLNILYEKIGGTVNEKGFKVLDKHVQLIQGDGVSLRTIENIINAIKEAKFSLDNVAFGSGGGLLQKFNRDTMKFAIKCSFVDIDGVGSRSVIKSPITDSGKANKPGRLKLVQDSTLGYRTISSAEKLEEYEQADDQLVTVFENGKLLQEYTFDEIRARCDLNVDTLDKLLTVNLSEIAE